MILGPSYSEVKILSDFHCILQYSAVGKVRGQPPKHAKYGTFQDAPAQEYRIALLFSEILKIRYSLEFSILR